MYQYPVRFEDDDGTVLVTFPDVPAAITFGADEVEGRLRAIDALESALAALIDDRADLPQPSPAEGRPTVSPTLRGTLKLSVYEAMRARGWRKADLARAMNANPRQIDRLLDLRHGSTVEQLEQALAACGQRASITTEALAA